MACVLDCINMDIEVRSEMHNQIVRYLEFHKLVVKLHCVRNWIILISELCGVASGFFESVYVLRLLI